MVALITGITYQHFGIFSWFPKEIKNPNVNVLENCKSDAMFRQSICNDETPACLAHFTLWALPSCPLDGRGTNLQAGRMIMLATTRTEQ